MLWYAIQVHSSYEKRFKSQLEENIKIEGFDNSFGRILIPTELVVEMKAGKKVKSEKKFFPGYVFVEVDLNSDSWNLIKSVPRFLQVVGSKGKPIPLSKKEVDNILSFINEDEGDVAQPTKLRKTYEVGEVVRVLDGPFNDFTGVVEDVNYEKSRLRVAVSIFGRSTPVELEFSQVEKES